MSTIIEDKRIKNLKNCPEEILNRRFSAGSIFKIFILGVANYLKIIDLYQNLNEIQDKMFLSDNDYFVGLIRKMTRSRFIEYSNLLFYPVYFSKKIQNKDFKDDFSFVYGGDLKFYPREIHNWFIQLLGEERNFMKEVILTMLVRQDQIEFFGKSGTWNGAAWYSGFQKNNENSRIITVLVTYEKGNWKKAKEEALKIFIDIISRLSFATDKI